MSFAAKLMIRAALLTGLSVSAGAQDVTITNTQFEQILSELRQIRQLLESQARANNLTGPSAKPVTLSLKHDRFIGSPDAPITMVEFTDFQCPFCQTFYLTTFREIKKNYIDSGKVRFYSLDLPLAIHKDSLQAAQAGRCAAEQGKYWELRDRMEADLKKLDLASLLAYGRDLGIDEEEFRRCIVSRKYESDIQRVSNDAAAVGAQATPTFVVGRSTAAGVDGETIVGAKPYEFFNQRLKQLGEQLAKNAQLR